MFSLGCCSSICIFSGEIKCKQFFFCFCKVIISLLYAKIKQMTCQLTLIDNAFDGGFTQKPIDKSIRYYSASTDKSYKDLVAKEKFHFLLRINIFPTEHVLSLEIGW